jgi:hypothetical protein
MVKIIIYCANTNITDFFSELIEKRTLIKHTNPINHLEWCISRRHFVQTNGVT